MGRLLAIRADQALSSALRDGLASSGHEVEFRDGDVDAIRRIRERAIDVVVTDPTTTVEEDLALMGELGQVRPGIKIILLAPAASHDDIMNALQAHTFACFTPPLELLEIVRMSRVALDAVAWRDGIEVVSALPHWVTLRVSCHLLTADRLVRFMSEQHSATVPERERDLLMTAFREMLVNAMEHGAGFDPEKVVEVTAARTKRAIVYHFRDPGAGFDQADLKHATESTDPELLMETALRRAEQGMRPGGFGMLIVRQIVDELVYNERGNEVLMVKYLDHLD
jgi:anti-sigma regulatory factor (Ser/Thr protein kinase)/CheY-like chemotaxis protein